MNVSCVECGPPPDAILHIPPPPLPAFLGLGRALVDQPACAAPCALPDTPAVEYVELPRHGAGVALDDTWLLVLVSSCAGVLLLGALLALLLLKCKLPRSGKVPLGLDGVASKGCEAVLYPDSRLALWAMLTPRGTAHQLADGAKPAPPPPPPEPDGSPRVSPPTRIQHPNLPPLNLLTPPPLPRRPRHHSDTASPASPAPVVL